MSKLGLNGTSSSSVFGKVKVTSTDNAEYLVEKIAGDGTIDVTQQTDSDGNQYLELGLNSSYATVDTYKVKKDGADVTPDYLETKLDEVFTAGDVLPDFLAAGTGIDLSAPASGVITFSLDAELDDINDVALVLSSDRDILSYDSGSAKWVNTALSFANSGLAWTETDVVPTADAIKSFVNTSAHSVSGAWTYNSDTLLVGKHYKSLYEITATGAIESLYPGVGNVYKLNPSAAMTVTLPAADEGRIVTLYKADSSTDYDVKLVSADAIGKSTTYNMPKRAQSVTLIGSPDNWDIISESHLRYSQDVVLVADTAMSKQDEIVNVTTHASVTFSVILPEGADLNGGEIYYFNHYNIESSPADLYLVTSDTATINEETAGTPVQVLYKTFIAVYDKEDDNWLVTNGETAPIA